MKNILVPTDLSQQSLDVVHHIVKKNPNQLVNIYLVHMVKVPTDISDLMFLKKSKLYDQVSHEFFRAINDLRETYPSQISSLRFEFYFGHRAGILNSIIENLGVEEIALLDSYKYALPLENSVDILPLIDRCEVPVSKAPVYGTVTVRGSVKKSASFAGHDSYSPVMQ